MPLSHRKLSVWYPQFAQQLEAGLAFTDALRSSRGTGMPEAALEAMAQVIDAGGTVENALTTGAPWLPVSDRLVLAAAADAGRFTHTLRSLGARHEQVYRAQLKLIAACAYPIGVFHIGMLLRPVLGMIDWEKGFTWSTTAYLAGVARTLVPFWLVVFAVVALARRRNPALGAIGRGLPILGAYFRHQGLSDFAFALGSFLDAGIRIDQAWANAGAASTLPDIQRAAAAIGEVIARGERPSAQLAAWPCFPPDFVALYHTGETAGQLDQNLLRLAQQYADKAGRALMAATIVYAALLFLLVALMTAAMVFKAYAGYFKMIEKLGS